MQTTDAPRRIQRKRTKGWKLPGNTVCVCRPGKWGNPFAVGPHMDAAEAVRAYAQWIKGQGRELLSDLHEIRGKNLACWCKPGRPCHADILLGLANGPDITQTQTQTEKD